MRRGKRRITLAECDVVCPLWRGFPGRKLADVAPAMTYKSIQRCLGRRIRTDDIRAFWEGVLRLVASVSAGIGRSISQSFARFGKNHPYRE